jgi:organic hydroperoxide reductase OsmC/OhrA
MDIDHPYEVTVQWQGNLGVGTLDYRAYSRDNLITAEGNPPIAGSSDRSFRGSPERWNPEELLVAALAQCHMLSYLHSAVVHGIVVTGYTDEATGSMLQQGNGGHFTSVTLHPIVTIVSGDPELARSIHAEASANCFIAQSVNFPVHHEPTILLADDPL